MDSENFQAGNRSIRSHSLKPTTPAFSTPKKRSTTRLRIQLAFVLPGGGSEAQSDIGISGFFISQSSAAIMIAVFFVQHNFPDSYTSGDDNWSYLKGAINGSSFLIMPGILNWFTADIAYHHVHHLSERIPNYRLRRCHEDMQNNFGEVKRLRLNQLWDCFSLILWDDESLQLVSAKQPFKR